MTEPLLSIQGAPKKIPQLPKTDTPLFSTVKIAFLDLNETFSIIRAFSLGGACIATITGFYIPGITVIALCALSHLISHFFKITNLKTVSINTDEICSTFTSTQCGPLDNSSIKSDEEDCCSPFVPGIGILNGPTPGSTAYNNCWANALTHLLLSLDVFEAALRFIPDNTHLSQLKAMVQQYNHDLREGEKFSPINPGLLMRALPEAGYSLDNRKQQDPAPALEQIIIVLHYSFIRGLCLKQKNEAINNQINNIHAILGDNQKELIQALHSLYMTEGNHNKHPKDHQDYLRYLTTLQKVLNLQEIDKPENTSKKVKLTHQLTPLIKLELEFINSLESGLNTMWYRRDRCAPTGEVIIPNRRNQKGENSQVIYETRALNKPRSLIIQLKRFKQDWKIVGDRVVLVDKKETKNIIIQPTLKSGYILKTVLCHLGGSLENGHYVTYKKLSPEDFIRSFKLLNNGKTPEQVPEKDGWYLFNDARKVIQVDEEKMLTNIATQGYIVTYEPSKTSELSEGKKRPQ